MHLYLECMVKSKIQNFPAPITTHIKYAHTIASLLNNTVFCSPLVTLNSFVHEGLGPAWSFYLL